MKSYFEGKTPISYDKAETKFDGYIDNKYGEDASKFLKENNMVAYRQMLYRFLDDRNLYILIDIEIE